MCRRAACLSAPPPPQAAGFPAVCALRSDWLGGQPVQAPSRLPAPRPPAAAHPSAARCPSPPAAAAARLQHASLAGEPRRQGVRKRVFLPRQASARHALVQDPRHGDGAAPDGCPRVGAAAVGPAWCMACQGCCERAHAEAGASAGGACRGAPAGSRRQAAHARRQGAAASAHRCSSGAASKQAVSAWAAGQMRKAWRPPCWVLKKIFIWTTAKGGRRMGGMQVSGLGYRYADGLGWVGGWAIQCSAVALSGPCQPAGTTAGKHCDKASPEPGA